MAKLSLILLVVVSLGLKEHVGAMLGGQELLQPLPYTVYILTGDPDDVRHMQKVEPKQCTDQENQISGNETGSQEGAKDGAIVQSNASEAQKAPQNEIKAPEGRPTEDKEVESNVSSQKNDEHEPASDETEKPQTVTEPELTTVIEHENSSPIVAFSTDESSTGGTTSKIGTSPMPSFEHKCKLANRPTPPAPTTKPPPGKLWKICMGVVFDEETILTATICFPKTEGMHFILSVNSTNHDDAQVVSLIGYGKNQLDFRAIFLEENQTMPGIVPDWTDEDSLYWKLGMLTNSSAVGIVPSFGNPPKVAAMKLLKLNKCQEIYDNLLIEYPNQSATLPAYLGNTHFCAAQADEPIDFPDGIGLVQPGQACPDSTGAPFVLKDGTILGVLVTSDCKTKKIAFFQTILQGTPQLDEEEEID